MSPSRQSPGFRGISFTATPARLSSAVAGANQQWKAIVCINAARAGACCRDFARTWHPSSRPFAWLPYHDYSSQGQLQVLKEVTRAFLK